MLAQLLLLVAIGAAARGQGEQGDEADEGSGPRGRHGVDPPAPLCSAGAPLGKGCVKLDP